MFVSWTVTSQPSSLISTILSDMFSRFWTWKFNLAISWAHTTYEIHFNDEIMWKRATKWPESGRFLSWSPVLWQKTGNSDQIGFRLEKWNFPAENQMQFRSYRSNLAVRLFTAKKLDNKRCIVPSTIMKKTNFRPVTPLQAYRKFWKKSRIYYCTIWTTTVIFKSLGRVLNGRQEKILS